MASNSGLSSANSDKNRRAVSEVGHAKNVSNFNLLIAAAESYGSNYNPSKLSLQLPQLYTLSIIAQDKLASVSIQNTAYTNAVNSRKEAFKGLQELSARITKTLEECGAGSATLEAAKEYNRKIHGKIIPTDPPVTGKIKLSYEQVVQLFEGLISTAENEPAYTSEDEQLNVKNLKALLEWLIQQNKAKTLAFNAIKNIRIERNAALYHPETGLLRVAEEMKKYIESTFGYSSAQFKQVNKLRFRKPKL